MIPDLTTKQRVETNGDYGYGGARLVVTSTPER